MSAETVAWTVLLFALCGASVTGLIIGGRWIESRTHAEVVAVETFPTAADVAAQHEGIKQAETEAVVEDMEALLDDALVHLERLRRAS